MTDEQRAKRIHYHMYETCEGIAEHAERIVRLEDENERLVELTTDMYDAFQQVLPDGHRLDFEQRMRELGIEVTENE